ncbi:MAG: hypothetical protein UIH41_06710, partial [Treponemataceae bacterium]|nr:hypothetical protein [Treponemataceae bacterium]
YMAWGLAEQDAEKRGYNAGIADGAEQKAIDTAKKMLLKLIPMDVVAECTGLPLETIQKLAKTQEK